MYLLPLRNSASMLQLHGEFDNEFENLQELDPKYYQHPILYADSYRQRQRVRSFTIGSLICPSSLVGVLLTISARRFCLPLMSAVVLLVVGVLAEGALVSMPSAKNSSFAYAQTTLL